MGLQISSALGIVAFVEHVKYGVHLTVNNLAVLILHISCQVSIVGFPILLAVRNNDRQRLHRPRNRHIQQIGIVREISDHIVHRGEHNGFLFPTLEFMNRRHLPVVSQLLSDGRRLIPIRRNHADIRKPLPSQYREHFLPDDIDLALIQMPPGMISRRRAVHGQHILLTVILRQDDQFSIVKLLIEKFGDFRMASVVLPQQHGRCVPPDSGSRGQHTVGSKVIAFIKTVTVPDLVCNPDILLCQHIWQLLLITDNHNISGTGECQHTGGQIHLRSLVHD